MTENNSGVCCSCDAWLIRRTKEYAYTQPGGVKLTHDCMPCLLPKAFGAYHKNQATNHIEADSCEGKKLPKYYLFLAEHLYLHLVIYL